ncbi:MAG: trypsin-like peptidase domain-containing protein [Candidatus Bathyarchaeia archaeon]
MQNANGYGKVSASLLVLLFAVGLLVGGLVTYYISFREIRTLNNRITILQNQLSSIQGSQNITYQSITIYQNATWLADIYENVRDSVVMVQGVTTDGEVQGSGFVYNYSGTIVVITNFHVVYDTTSISVTFPNGKGYSAKILGTDAYVDLAVLSVNAPTNELKPIEIVSSSTLQVGDTVIAIGNPYGLVGSLTTGVVSALGRTITEEYAGGFSIANIIQTSAPINPGNSGGPLLNAVGKVVGVTTAIVSDSQGLGFAIPSNTILREIGALITTGKYNGHSYLGVKGQDMSYAKAQELGVDITYGWRIIEVNKGGPSDGKLRPGDIIIAINGTTIRNNDDLASYLAEKTLPNEHITITVIRDNKSTTVDVVLGTRPPPPV